MNTANFLLDNLKISIITIVYNREKTIKDTINSVLNQTYKNIEYIIIDGKSTDSTLNIVNSYKDKISKIISEKDDGLYDALNKGINLATGDIIGFIHSDDFYIDNFVIEKVANEFKKNNPDTLFADLVYIKDENKEKIHRYYSAKNFTPNKLKYGLMPPHPTFFVKKEVYQKYGLYKTDYKIAGDFEMITRLLLVNKLSFSYLNTPLVKMRLGGISTSSFKQRLKTNKEVLRALKENGIKANHLSILKKYPTKIKELLKAKFYNLIRKS